MRGVDPLLFGRLGSVAVLYSVALWPMLARSQRTGGMSSTQTIGMPDQYTGFCRPTFLRRRKGSGRHPVGLFQRL